ncbi:ThiF family adenylyltransferase [Corynebacterium guangdongense]|uniref:Adenylyltransferase/sulfurtransferase n=1 Tax=Corynebacterium guangdongense TaxID=1783348 RepID=A0ABU1ZXF1_9CORY|nr:ThiF family adenylyltransferase [Corynebacterium guangdongense]MDR7329618.1 adenylyltransferase/sulfurtransferase [Corynebacterium guangdongense]WJZ18183.1 putative adenylyltransferase/sulfurtransferase MoeZ [Corynebacterium guangdongense]
MDRTELRRIARQLNLPGFGIGQARRLNQARVLVVGAGGLGCPALQTLVASGLGRVRLYDDDTVSLSNIHRQILFGVDDVGRPKVAAAAERLRALQPGLEIEAVRERLTPATILAALEGVDVILDGSDTFATKYLVADAAEITGVPLVWGTVLRYSGQFAVWHSGPGAPEDSPGLRDLFPVQPAADSVPDCATAGVLGVTTSVLASLMATETIKLITGLGEVVPGTVFSYEALRASLSSLRVRRDPGRAAVRRLRDFYGYGACAAADRPGPHPEATRLLGLIAGGSLRALDVREVHEKLIADLPTGADLHLPASELTAESLAEVLEGVPGPVVVYCASGRRSARVVEKWGGREVDLLSLPGGVNGLTP